MHEQPEVEGQVAVGAAGVAQPVEGVAPVVAKAAPGRVQQEAAPGRVQQEAAPADPVQRERALQGLRVRAMLAVQQRRRQVVALVVVTPDMAGAAAPANRVV